MSDNANVNIIDPSNFITLEEAVRETNLPDISILFYSPEVLMDCTPTEPSYVWMGTGTADRDLRKMPNFGFLLPESIKELSRRLCNYHINKDSFALLHNLKIKTEKGFLRLTKPVGAQVDNMPGPSLKVEDIPMPVLLVSADLDYYGREISRWARRGQRQDIETEGELCLAWGHSVEELEKLAQALEQLGYIKSASIWCKHFRTIEDSPLKRTSAPKIEWLKYKKLIHQVLRSTGTTLKEGDWEIHFGISRPGGLENEDEDLQKIIKQAMLRKHGRLYHR